MYLDCWNHRLPCKRPLSPRQSMKLKEDHSVQFSSVAQSCPTLCDPMNCSTPGLPVHHQLPESTQTDVHWVGDAIQSSHPLSSPSPPALNLSQHWGLFQWASSSLKTIKRVIFVCTKSHSHRADNDSWPFNGSVEDFIGWLLTCLGPLWEKCSVQSLDPALLSLGIATLPKKMRLQLWVLSVGTKFA